MAWFKCVKDTGGTGGYGCMFPMMWTNYYQNIQSNRSVSISGTVLSSPVTATTNCVGILSMAVTMPVGCTQLMVKYTLQAPSINTSGGAYSATIFCSDAQKSTVTDRTDTYGNRILVEKDLSSGESGYYIDAIEVPSSSFYFNIQFGCSNFKSFELFAVNTAVVSAYTDYLLRNGSTPISFNLPSTENRTTRVSIYGTSYAPAPPTGFIATSGTITDRVFNVTQTSAYHWSYTDVFNITCGDSIGVIKYNDALNDGSQCTALVTVDRGVVEQPTESYIYNVGNVGFNTGHKHTANTKVILKAFVDPFIAGYGQVFGARATNYSNSAFGFFSTFNASRYCFYRTGQEAQGDLITASESSTSAPWFDTCIFTAFEKTLSWYRESDPLTVRSITASSGTANAGIAPLGIFCCNNSNTADGWQAYDLGIRMRLYWFEIYESDVLVHRFVPAYNNDQYCLYDEVEEVYIYDAINSGNNLRGFVIS